MLILLKPSVEFEIVKTQSFNVLKNKFIATKVDEANKEILELNKSAALDAYSESVSVEPGSAASKFMTYPLGVMVGNDPFVRSPRSRQAAKELSFTAMLLKEQNLLSSVQMILLSRQNRL